PFCIYDSLVRHLKKRGSPSAIGLNFLDLGCGAGQSTLSFSRFCSERGWKFHGTAVDGDPGMIAAARSSAADAGGDLDYRVGIAEEIPLPDRSVDLVLIA